MSWEIVRFILSPLGVSIIVGTGFVVWLCVYATPKQVNSYARIRATASTGKRKRVNEETCRTVFESIFGVPFPSIRPQWLKSPITNSPLELDGFAPDIETPIGRGLAFEYDGNQHEDPDSYFHGGDVSKYEYQVAKDRFKTSRCKKMGVLLIRIPSKITKNHERYIRDQLRRYFVL